MDLPALGRSLFVVERLDISITLSDRFFCVVGRGLPGSGDNGQSVNVPSLYLPSANRYISAADCWVVIAAVPSMEFLFDYLSFLAKTVTIVIAFVVVVSVIVGASLKRQGGERGHLEVTWLNDRLIGLKHSVQQALLGGSAFKKLYKKDHKAQVAAQKAADKPRLFVLDFDGDIQASNVDVFRREITAVLTVAEESDEVLLRLESPGGVVAGYGLAASQLARVRDRGVRLTVAVDQVAASGGYLMASVAHHIIAAPFAVVGSIGVLAQLPNVHRLLKKHDVDIELHTAGQYKRTLTVFGENTDEGRAKFREELEDIHQLFQQFVGTYRQELDLAEVATGETWYGERAVARKLVDTISTSDEYLMAACEEKNVYQVSWVEPKNRWNASLAN